MCGHIPLIVPNRARQQDRPNGVGDDDQGQTLQGACRIGGVNEIAPAIWRRE